MINFSPGSKLLAFSLLGYPLASYGSCFVGIPDDCPSGKVCAMYNNKGDSECFEIQKAPAIVFDLPFDQISSVICTQSGRATMATHRWRNTLYAIDLATPYSIKNPATIYASAPGKAFVHGGCKNPKGGPAQTDVDNCGLGYGNHVFLLHDDGYATLYAHLSEIFVKTGDLVLAHQKLGLEGASGQAAHRHLHWDVHKLDGKKLDWEKQLSHEGWGGNSIPFNFKVKINGTEKIIKSSEIACRFLDQAQAPWTGTFNEKVK
jgi:murein DD-endopeptidase MepM/ murein hydrolase activator NlpD